MKNLSKQLKRVGLFGSACFFVISFILPVYFMNGTVYAATSGSWIDAIKVTINHNGEEIIMTDSNPYDDDKNWQGGRLSRGDCRHNLTVDDYDGNGTRGTFTYKILEADGNCEEEDFSVTLTNAGQRKINAYRLNADDIWLYLHFDRSVSFTVGCGGSKYDRIRDGARDGYGIFTRRPADERDDGQDDEYLQRNDADDGNDLTDKIYVETARDPAQLTITWIVQRSLGRECTNSYDIYLSPDPPPEIYEFDSGEVPPIDDPDGGGGDDEDGPPSCEEKNPGISLSWFLCSVINFFDNTVQGLTNVVDDLLQIDAAYYTDANLKTAWSYFRNIASFLLIVIGLVMIIGQAITKG